MVIECLERFETLDAFLAWAMGGTGTGAGAVTAAQPMPEAGDQVLYVTPRPAVMEINASLLGNYETRRKAWDECNLTGGRLSRAPRYFDSRYADMFYATICPIRCGAR